jgi:two-component system, OmpR family, response regulator
MLIPHLPIVLAGTGDVIRSLQCHYGSGILQRSGSMNIEKVLVIDDDPKIRRIAEISLKNIGGWKVFQAESGRVGLQEVKENKPDVILMDVMMPQMDGLSALALMREEGITTPVIFMTAKVHKEEVEMYTQLGATGVIMKPFDPMRLSESVKKILNDDLQVVLS